VYDADKHSRSQRGGGEPKAKKMSFGMGSA